MADEIPSIPKAGSFYVHTGNIVNWNRLKRKLTQSPSEEVSACWRRTLISNYKSHAVHSQLVMLFIMSRSMGIWVLVNIIERMTCIVVNVTCSSSPNVLVLLFVIGTRKLTRTCCRLVIWVCFLSIIIPKRSDVKTSTKEIHVQLPYMYVILLPTVWNWRGCFELKVLGEVAWRW